MRVRKDIVRALRCTATVHETVDCTGCPYLLEETVPEDMAEALGSKLRLSCDTDQVALDAAEMLETDKRTISALTEDRKRCMDMEKYYMEKCEELESQVPLEEEGGAGDDEA